jgi:hypothetical protein
MVFSMIGAAILSSPQEGGNPALGFLVLLIPGCVISHTASMTPSPSWPTTWALQKKGLEALKIEWDEGPHAKLSTQDVADELERATLTPGVVAQNIGDVGSALARANVKVEAIYQMPFLAHATMEPMNCTVHLQKDSSEIWVGSQVLARVQAAAAKVFF